MTDPEFPRERNVNHKVGEPTYFFAIFAHNCMKMKIFALRREVASLAPSCFHRCDDFCPLHDIKRILQEIRSVAFNRE